MNDPVNHPSHYCKGKYESIEVMTEVFVVEAVKSFALLNAFKYLWRSDSKGYVEDIRKAVWYLKKYLELTESEEPNYHE